MGTSLTAKPSAWLESCEWPDGFKGSMMDRLFNRLDGTYPNRWRAAFGSQQAITNWREAWAEAFIEEGLSPQEVKVGIVQCRKLYDWPPSLAEFIKACRPPIDYEAAFSEAIAQMRKRETGEDQWSSPAVYWAAASIGDFDLRNRGYTGPMVARWKSELDKAIAEVKAGSLPAMVPPRLNALPAPGQTTLSREEQLQRIAKLREQFGMAGIGKMIVDQVENAVKGGES